MREKNMKKLTLKQIEKIYRYFDTHEMSAEVEYLYGALGCALDMLEKLEEELEANKNAHEYL